MDKRLGTVVGLFGGVIAMIVVWLVLTSSATQETARVKKPQLKDRKMVQVDPQLRPMDVARIRNNPAMRPVRTDGTSVRTPMRVRPTVPDGVDGVFPLDQDGIAAAVDQQKAELQACYETALFHTPGLSGRMTLELQVVPVEGQPHATIETVEIDSDLDATLLEGCIATVFEDLKFAATEPGTIRWPLVLSTREGAAPSEVPEEEEPAPDEEGEAPADPGAP